MKLGFKPSDIFQFMGYTLRFDDLTTTDLIEFDELFGECSSQAVVSLRDSFRAVAWAVHRLVSKRDGTVTLEQVQQGMERLPASQFQRIARLMQDYGKGIEYG